MIDEVVEEGEYHEEALEAAKIDFASEKLSKLDIQQNPEDLANGDTGVIAWFQCDCSKKAYALLVGCLTDCGCLRSAFNFVSRARKAFPDNEAFEQYHEIVRNRIEEHLSADGDDFHDAEIDDYPDKGVVRREQYPWNHHEPDRFSQECLDFLNDELEHIAPRLKVRAVELPLLTPGTASQTTTEIAYTKQLGLVATEQIKPGEQTLEEKSLLTAITRLHDSYCDACSIALPSMDAADSESNIFTCEDCDEVFFCSSECQSLAQDHYHPALCGITADDGKVPAKEASDFLYSRLLIRALALAETQDIHPLELKEVRFIWGDYHGLSLDDAHRTDSSGHLLDAFGSIPTSLPFSFKYNVLVPQQIMEKMDINIFTHTDRYDTWIFNTLYAKFRGTASAQQGPDGRPEIGAVHPMWCLANHSCDPNVSWEWSGSMRFWTRENLVDWPGRDPRMVPGLEAGQEVFSHYCDVRLPVTERREWAVGALGGQCMCPRCIWEDAQPGETGSATK